MDELVLIAEIKSVDRNGFVSIESFSYYSDRFLGLKEAVIEIFGAFRPIIISDSVINGKEIFLKFKNFDTADKAQTLLKSKLYIQGSDKIQLPEDTYFVHDLVGCLVYKGSMFIGNLIDVLILPANDAYLIKDNNNKEFIIPATQDAVKSVNIQSKTIYLNENYELVEDVED